MRDGAIYFARALVGGHLALQAALAVPGRIDGVVLVDPFGSVADGGAIAMAETLAARLLPETRQRAAEVGEAIAGGNHSTELGAEFLALQWPGYFAQPESAPPPPPGLLLNFSCNGETMASVFGELQSGFADRLAGCEVPVELVAGQRSPLPFAVSEQTAKLLPARSSRLSRTPAIFRGTSSQAACVPR